MFTVYFPFRLSPERELKSLPFDSTIAGLPAQVIKNDPYRAVEVSGIESEEQALVLVESFHLA
jgi:hypothetical protein